SELFSGGRGRRILAGDESIARGQRLEHDRRQLSAGGCDRCERPRTEGTDGRLMNGLILRAAEACRFDEVSLGEVMLRLDPGEGRIRTARQFTAWEGGGEYNVARGLRRCFGQRTAVATALVDNEVG